MAELVDAADSKSVFERSGSSILPRGTIFKKDLEFQGLFFRLLKSIPIQIARFSLLSVNCLPAQAALETGKLVSVMTTASLVTLIAKKR